MSLSYQDQIELLKDIMTNHLEDCCGSVSECKQIGRLVKSLLINQQIHPNLAPVLEEIYDYCQNGSQSPDLAGHISSHQENLSHWIGDMNNYN